MTPLLLLLALAPGDPFQRHVLPGGAELLVLEAPAAPGESVFVALPHGLVDDASGRAQGAHLLEHFLIRGADQDGLEVDGLRINGETGGAQLRLEVLAPAERWRDALARPARWLATRAAAPEVLARERQRIGEELANTVRAGFTHKWALAAWSQVAAGGLEHAAVAGDPARADAPSLAAEAERFAILGPGARIVAAGPAKASEVLESVQREYAAFLHAPPSGPVASVRPVRAHSTATWDLAAEHDLVWATLPDEKPADRAAAFVLELGAWQQLLQSSQGVLAPGQAQVELTRLPGLGRALLVSAGGFEKARGKDVRALLEGVLAALARRESAKSWNATLEQCRQQAGQEPDFAALRKQLSGNPFAAWIEGQHALDLMSLEARTDLALPRLRELLEKEAGARAAALAKGLVDPARRGSLRLSPGG